MTVTDADSLDAERLQGHLLEAAASSQPLVEAFSEAFAGFSPEYVEQTKDGTLSISIPKDRRPMVETAFHLALLAILTASHKARTPMMDFCGPVADEDKSSSPLLPRVLDIALHLADTGQTEPSASLSVLEDVVDACSGNDAPAVFAYIQSKVALFKKPELYKHCKLLILRSINALLKRVSAPSAPALCGSMLMFLATFFPLSERSGVNVAGLYNTGNVTHIEDVAEGTTDSQGNTVDVAFYNTFWGLQPLFANPVTVLEKGMWGHMVRDVKTVLQRFQQQPVSTTAATLDEDNVREHNPKFLTSPQVFHLQLRDAEFRQHFLLQVLILLHQARHPGKGEAPRQRQLQDVDELHALAVEQLRLCGATGKEVAALAATVLAREKHWVEWKAAIPIGCPSFEKPPATLQLVPAHPIIGTKRKAEDQHTVVLGTPALDMLWNQTDDNGECLGPEDREHLPSLKEFLEPVAEQMQAGDEVAAEDKVVKNPVYQWKSLRLLAKHNVMEFAATCQAPNTLEYTVTKLGMASPGGKD